MHYVKIKTRVRIYMHDVKITQRAQVVKMLNKHKIDYRYIEKQCCISLPFKHEALVRYIIELVSKQFYSKFL